MKEFRGSYSVLVTPFTEDGEHIDEGALRRLVEWQVGEGAPGIIILGSTGEFLSVTDDERIRIVGVTVDQVKGRIPVIVGTANEWTQTAVRYSREAERLGADGLMIVPPYYCEPKDDEIFAYYRSIGEAVSLPIMLYNNPFYSNVDLKPEMVARLTQIDNVRYIKESSGDIARIQAILRLAGDRMTVFGGFFAYDSFLLGAKGWVTVAGNFMPRLTAEMFQLVVTRGESERGRALYHRMLPLINATDGYVARTKAVLELIGMGCGKPRPPRLPASPADVDMVRRMLLEIGLLKGKAAE